MDPFSIATGCVSLLTGVSKLTIQISTFVASVRDARKDMAAVSGELSSLSLCLESLRDDSMKIDYPDGFRQNLITVLKNCDTVTTEMTTLLDKLASANLLRRFQWSTMGRDDMNRLRSSLQSHKSALEIGLDMTSVLLISAVKVDLVDVKADTTRILSIKQDTSQIESLVQQIGLLRLQLENGPVNDGKARHLRMFLDQSTSYAETVMDGVEEETSPVHTSEEHVLESSKHGQHAPIAAVDFDIVCTSRIQLDTHGFKKSDISNQWGADGATIKHEEVPWPPLKPSISKRSERSFEGQLRTFSLSERSEERPSTLDKDTVTNSGFHHSAVHSSSPSPATGGISNHLEERRTMKNISASPGAECSFQQRDLSAPASLHPEKGRKGMLLPIRDKTKNSEATERRKQMSRTEREKKNKALEVAVCGRTSFPASFTIFWVGYSTKIGCYDDIKRILDEDADPNYQPFGEFIWKLYRYNSKNEDVLNMLYLLLLYGASLRQSSADALLCKAAEVDHKKLAKHLLDAGASPNTAYRPYSALCYTILLGHSEMMSLLLDRGAIADDDSLRCATSKGREDWMEMLLEHEPSSISKIGKKLVKIYALTLDSPSSSSRLELLLKHGMSAEDPEYICAAAKSGNARDAEILLQKGASANSGRGGQRALVLAIEECNLEVLRVLIEHGAIVRHSDLNVEIYEDNGKTAESRKKMRAEVRRHYNQQQKSKATKGP